jgi:methionine aminotransferase
MVFDGAPHESVCRYPDLAARSFVVSSFGKTFHVTGWKIGYVAAPAALTAEFRKVHQFNVFTVNTPMQVGIAEYLKDPAPYLELPAFYQQKRDFFREGLANSRFKLLAMRRHVFPVRRLFGHQRPA